MGLIPTTVPEAKMVKKLGGDVRQVQAKQVKRAETPKAAPTQLRKPLMRSKGDGITTSKPRIPSVDQPDVGPRRPTGELPAAPAPQMVSLVELMRQGATRTQARPTAARPPVHAPTPGHAVATPPAPSAVPAAVHENLTPASGWTPSSGRAPRAGEYEAFQKSLGAEGSPERIAYEKAAHQAHCAAQGLVFNEGNFDRAQQAAALIRDLHARGIMDPAQGIVGTTPEAIANALAAGVPLATIKQHYEAMSSQLGPRFATMMHGSLALLDPEKLMNGTMGAAVLANAR